MKNLLALATLTILAVGQAGASEQKLSENGYTSINFVEDSFGQTNALPSIRIHIIWKDGSGDYIRTVAVEGCSVGEGKLYFSGGGKSDSEDSWEMSDRTSNERIAQLVCNLSKRR